MQTAKQQAGKQRSGTFFAELRRRRVLHIGGVYIAGAWLLTEIVSFLLEQAGAPAWAFPLMAILFVVGFPVAVVLAWVIQIQPDGSWAIDRSRGQHRTVVGAIALGLLATAGLSWLILPGIPDSRTDSHYEPLPDSVAILPLADSGSTPIERTVADTLYTALVEGLNESPELTLVRLRLKDKPRDVTAFGRSVSVAVLLVGRILQEPGGTRIEIGLLDVGSGETRWSRTFDWDPTRIMDTGGGIANSVLEAMDLPPLSRQRFAGTNNQQAYEAVLMGLEKFSSFRLEELALAMEYFQQAIGLDPAYVQAHVHLAVATLLYKNMKGPPEDERQALDDRARKALETALELDDESAAAISMLGRMAESRELRIQAYQHALELDPKHALSYFRLGWEMLAEGNAEETERLWRMALELDPMDANTRAELADLLVHMERADEAVAEIHKSIALEPEMPFSHEVLGRMEYFELGHLDEAIKHFRTAYSLDPELGSAASFVAVVYAELGSREEALAWTERSLQLSPTKVWARMGAYFALMMLGEEDEAVAHMERAMELNPRNPHVLRELGARDIAAGRAQLALQRWQRTYPVLTGSDDPVIDLSNIVVAMDYATNLAQAGDSGRARLLAQHIQPVLMQVRTRSEQRDYQSRISAVLGQKDQALEALRAEIVDGRRRWGLFSLDQAEFDFLRDDPEFQRLMQIAKTDLAEQLERVREMERNGELAPAPGVVIETTSE
jgi:tetratricopeptide (TPR) repeat protein